MVEGRVAAGSFGFAVVSESFLSATPILSCCTALNPPPRSRSAPAVMIVIAPGSTHSSQDALRLRSDYLRIIPQNRLFV